MNRNRVIDAAAAHLVRRRHVFRLDDPCLSYMALGDSAVRAIAIDHTIRAYRLNAIIVPPRNTHLLDLWRLVFGQDRVVADASLVPESHRDATVSRPNSLDWFYGNAGWSVFEAVMWENGFFETRDMTIKPPEVFPCDLMAGAALVYPLEGTDGNRVYDSKFWVATCRSLRERGLKLHHLGELGHERLRELYERVTFDAVFEATIRGLQEAASRSSLAIGASTGPTWALLMSPIQQIVLESKRSPHGYWFFDRCQAVLAKRLMILPTLDALLPR